jgi:Holliday junction resolvase RusA-like endonuclease
MQIEFEVLGKVKAKQSVKFANIGGFMKKYTPADIKSYANWVRLCFMKEYPNWTPNKFKDTPLMCEIDVDVIIPKSFSKKKHELALGGYIRPTVKPDCDNIAKNIDDALNGIAYPDDKQIVSLVVRKWYSDTEKVKIRVSEV